jgi:hypothetical protein
MPAGDFSTGKKSLKWQDVCGSTIISSEWKLYDENTPGRG